MVVQHMESWPQVFGEFFDGEFDSFADYLSYMRRPGSWGDHLCIQAAAHILLTPIHIITDGPSDAGEMIVIEPPPCISHEVWQDPIFIAHHSELHYEATMLLLPPAKQESSSIKKEPHGDQ